MPLRDIMPTSKAYSSGGGGPLGDGQVHRVQLPLQLERHLGAGALEHAARAHVEVLGVLPQEDDVEVLLRFERSVGMPGLGRPQVDVLVEGRPHLDQDALLQHSRRHPGVADGAEVHRLVLADESDVLVGQQLPGPQVAVRAQVHVVQLELDAARPRPGP